MATVEIVPAKASIPEETTEETIKIEETKTPVLPELPEPTATEYPKEADSAVAIPTEPEGLPAEVDTKEPEVEEEAEVEKSTQEETPKEEAPEPVTDKAKEIITDSGEAPAPEKELIAEEAEAEAPEVPKEEVVKEEEKPN